MRRRRRVFAAPALALLVVVATASARTANPLDMVAEAGELFGQARTEEALALVREAIPVSEAGFGPDNLYERSTKRVEYRESVTD